MADDPMPSTSTCGSNVRHVIRGGTGSEDSAEITRRRTAERMRNYRERQKLSLTQEQAIAARKVDTERKRRYRQHKKGLMNDNIVDEQSRIKHAEKMREYRKRKKMAMTQDVAVLQRERNKLSLTQEETRKMVKKETTRSKYDKRYRENQKINASELDVVSKRLQDAQRAKKYRDRKKLSATQNDLILKRKKDAERKKKYRDGVKESLTATAVPSATSHALDNDRILMQHEMPSCSPRLPHFLFSYHGSGENDSELPVEQHQPVNKIEKEWDSDDDCGPSQNMEWGNDGDGPVNASLEDGTGSSDGHCLSSSHTAGEPERVQKFAELCPANYVESFMENDGDHIKVERLCRLCLAELNAFTYIFEFDDIHRFNVADAISDLLGMDLNPDDGHPTKICNDCLEEVAHFRRFKGICFESKAKLKDMIDEKNYYDDQIKSGDGDSHLRAMEGEKNEIPIRSELAEADPRSGDVSMLETHVKCEIVDSDVEEMEDSDMRNEDVNTIMNSSQTRLAAGKVHEDVSHSSQHAGRVKVKKQYMIFCQPVYANDKRDNAVEGTVTMSDSAQHIKNGAPKKSGITSDSSSDLPVTISTDLVPVKTEISSADKNGADQQEYHSKGGKLAS